MAQTKAQPKHRRKTTNAQETVAAAGRRITIWIDEPEADTPDGRDFNKPGPDGIEYRQTLAAIVESENDNGFGIGADIDLIIHKHMQILIDEIRASGANTEEDFVRYRERRDYRAQTQARQKAE